MTMQPADAPKRLSPRILVVAGCAWGLFAAWLVFGMSPPVDLAGHGAQLETLACLLRGDAEVAKIYEWHPVIGYGLEVWLFLPLTLLTNGAFAVKAAMWLTVMLFPVAHLLLCRTFNRCDTTAVLGLPLVFSMSYWWGLLSGLMAQVLMLFALSTFVAVVRRPTKLRWLLVILLCAAVMQSHLITFAALCVVLSAIALSEIRAMGPMRVIGSLAIALGPALVLAVPRVLVLLTRAVDAGGAPETEYNAEAHVNWFFKHYVPEGNLQSFLPAVLSGLFLLMFLLRWRKEPRTPAWAAVAMAVAYALTPKTLSGILLVSQRLASLVGLLALQMADVRVLPRWGRRVLMVACFASLGQTALFHFRFARALDGFDEVTQRAPRGRHGYLSLVGRRILDSKAIYLEHVGQWWTARFGGVGHNFFAEYDHHVIRFRPGVSLPNNLLEASDEERATFDEVLVFGEGVLPAPFDTYAVDAQAGRWMRLVRPSR